MKQPWSACRRRLVARDDGSGDHVGRAALPRAAGRCRTYRRPLLGQQQTTGLDTARQARLRGAMLDRLDESPPAPARQPSGTSICRAPTDPDCLPQPLQLAVHGTPALRWVAPGVHMIRTAQPGRDTLLLLRIARARACLRSSRHRADPDHRGAYDDVLGRFGPGDAADLDNETEHHDPHRRAASVSPPGCRCASRAGWQASCSRWLAFEHAPAQRQSSVCDQCVRRAGCRAPNCCHSDITPTAPPDRGQSTRRCCARQRRCLL